MHSDCGNQFENCLAWVLDLSTESSCADTAQKVVERGFRLSIKEFNSCWSHPWPIGGSWRSLGEITSLHIEVSCSPVSAASTESEQEILEQLTRITSSHTFQQVDRLKRFISFVVSETVSGRGDRLKEFVIGAEVFDKDGSFDPRNDPIVRVQARRLRARLTKYYQDEGSHDPLMIDLPRGGYSPTFKRVEAPQKRSMNVRLASRNTVTVLGFADQSPSHDLGYFCEGLRQEISHHLVRCAHLRVIAADPSLAESVARPPMQELSKSLDAAMLIRGSVRRSGNILRIGVDVIDGTSSSYLWSDSFDEVFGDSLTIQEAIARAVVSKFAGDKGDDAAYRRFTKSRENLAARNLYLQGRYHMNQRTEEGLRKATEVFEKALVEDGQYARALSGLADAWGLLGHYGVLPPAEVWTKAASSAMSAVLADENSAEPHTSLAHVKSTQDWDWSGAEHEFRRAIELDPRYPTAHHWYAISCLAPTGRLDEALDEILIAQSLDPISSIIARDLALIQHFRRDSEAALDQIDLAIELNPHFSPAYWTLGLIQEHRGEIEEALASFQRAIQLSPKSPKMRGALAQALALSGRREEAEQILKDLETLSESRYVSPFELAAIHFALGDRDTGFEWLSQAFRDRCFELVQIQVDPRFDSLRDDPRFRPLVAQLGFPPRPMPLQ